MCDNKKSDGEIDVSELGEKKGCVMQCHCGFKTGSIVCQHVKGYESDYCAAAKDQDDDEKDV